jgi:hypothetical protein
VGKGWFPFLLVVFLAGCTSNELVEESSSLTTGYVTLPDTPEESEAFSTTIKVCESYDGVVLSDCNTRFELNNKLYYYTTKFSDDLRLFLYHNSSLHSSLNITDIITGLDFPVNAGGNWTLELLKDSTIVNSFEFSFSYGVPAYIGEVTTNTVNNDADMLRDIFIISNLHVYNTNGDRMPVQGVLKVELYGIFLNRTTGFIQNIVFLDRWETLINTFSDTLLLSFNDNSTNVFDYDYGQVYITLITEHGNYSYFNPEARLI